MVYKLGQISANTKANSKMAQNTAKVNIHGMITVITEDNGRTV